MSAYEQALKQTRWRLAAILILRETLGYLTAFAFVWGTAVLVCRVLLSVPVEVLWWGLAATPLVVAVAAVLAWRRLPQADQLRALLDGASGCGGMYLASEEQSLGPWEESLPPPAELRWRWHGGKSCAFLAAALSFLFAGLLFPERFMVLGSNPALEVGKKVEKLSAQIAVLKKEGILEPERADSFQQKLNKLKEEASGLDPVKTLEALDHLSQLATKTANEAAEAAAGKSERLGKAEALAEGLREAGGAADPKVKKEAMAELAALMNKAALENKLLNKLLDPKAFKDALKGSLTPEQLKNLAKALGAGKAELMRLAEKLHEAKLIDLDLLRKCKEAGMCDGKALGKCLAAGNGQKSVAQMLCECQSKGKSDSEFGGKGGVTEGPGHNPITWTKGTSEDGAKFKEETLPPGALASLKDSKLIGVGQTDPSKEKPGGASLSGVLNPALAGGGSANTQIVLPRHRKTVERYFNRPGPSNK